MNPHDPIKRTSDPKVAEPPRTPVARADVSVGGTQDKTKITVRTEEGAVAKGWAWPPKDGDDWKRFLRAVVPWVAGAAIIVAAGSAMRRAKTEDEETGYGDVTRRKAKRAKDQAESAWDDTKEKAQRGWFGLKRSTERTAEEVGDNLESAKDAAARKANEARGAAQDAKGYVREKAYETKEAAKDTGRWVGNKAHDAADAAKGTYRSAADTASRAAHKVEDKVAAAGSAVVATAATGEEKTGAAMKQVGQALEKDGADARRYYKGEQVQAEAKKKGGCSIM